MDGYREPHREEEGAVRLGGLIWNCNECYTAPAVAYLLAYLPITIYNHIIKVCMGQDPNLYASHLIHPYEIISYELT